MPAHHTLLHDSLGHFITGVVRVKEEHLAYLVGCRIVAQAQQGVRSSCGRSFMMVVMSKKSERTTPARHRLPIITGVLWSLKWAMSCLPFDSISLPDVTKRILHSAYDVVVEQVSREEIE